MSIVLIDRESLVALPWVTELAWSKPCQGVKRDRAAGMRCKLRARYHYEGSADPDEYGMTGDFCAHHAGSQVYHDGDRLANWRKAQL